MLRCVCYRAIAPGIALTSMLYPPDVGREDEPGESRSTLPDRERHIGSNRDSDRGAARRYEGRPVLQWDRRTSSVSASVKGVQTSCGCNNQFLLDDCSISARRWLTFRVPTLLAALLVKKITLKSSRRADRLSPTQLLYSRFDDPLSLSPISTKSLISPP